MKKACVIFFILLAAGGIRAQVRCVKIFEANYENLPFRLRIENSGIYSVSSFDIEKDDVMLIAFDEPAAYSTARKSLNKSAFLTAPGNTKIFLNGREDIYSGSGGILTNASKDKISITVLSRRDLEIRYDAGSFQKTFRLNFPGDLAYADLTGIDAKGNSFILTERYVSEVPLKIRRDIYTISGEGALLSVLNIPPVKYLSTIRDFQTDAEGNLYHLLTEKNKLTVLKWSGLTEHQEKNIVYPSEYNYELHYNSNVPTNEYAEASHIAVSAGKHTMEIKAVGRNAALRLGESYVLHKYHCTPANLSPSNITGPDGDIVRTPSWLTAGMNARVPYMWGGFNTLASFDNGLLQGKYAGDINTAGVSGYAVGVDCSGFVSRCWQLSYHSSTRMMPDITGGYTSWDEMKPGDAVLIPGHVRMFIERTPNGALRIVEASARDWGVSYYTYAPSDLTGYSPRYYTGMVNDYSLRQPELLSAAAQADGTARIVFSCDTAGVKGFRLYSSSDGMNWKQIMDESSLKTTSASFTPAANTEYYRVSSVMNNSPYFSESSWSNVLGIRKQTASQKVLIVDGFERNSGGWRGNGHTFVTRYGNALSDAGIAFESAKNSQLQSASFALKSYDSVIWLLGDESTVNETFSISEQALVKEFLEAGGKLFVSGSEAGWDLSAKGSAEDRLFYNDYFKAVYIADNAASNIVSGAAGSALNGISFNISQAYEIGYPDEIGINGGSTVCMRYANGKTAGIQYSGTFGASVKPAKLIYLGFPLETTANDSSFNKVIAGAANFFFNQSSSAGTDGHQPGSYYLDQNYPNPFNPSTSIMYSIAEQSFVRITVYNLLGETIDIAVNAVQGPGKHEIRFSARDLSSGLYLYSIDAEPLSGGSIYHETRKMVLLK